jgi:protein TonB
VPTATDATPAAAPLTSEARVDTDYLDNPKPAYPLMSRRLGEQGTVLLRVTVGEQGEVRAVALEESCGHARLDEAALRAVRHWRFLPAQRAGVAVTSSVLVPVTFSLAGS